MTRALTTQDTRTDAREIKFLVSPDQAGRIRDWARTRLAADPHGAGDHGDEYRTASLYFDTDQLDVFHRRGSYGRSKYRVRRYGAADVVFLERKMRTKQLLSKRRTIVPVDRLVDLIDDDPGWNGAWFRRRLMARRLHAKCQVWYTRTARIGQSAYGTFRLTIDTALETRPAAGLVFLPPSGVAALTGDAIVEMKFIHEMPAMFKHLVEEFALEPHNLSKYRLAMQALGEREADVVVHA